MLLNSSVTNYIQIFCLLIHHLLSFCKHQNPPKITSDVETLTVPVTPPETEEMLAENKTISLFS